MQGKILCKVKHVHVQSDLLDTDIKGTYTRVCIVEVTVLQRKRLQMSPYYSCKRSPINQPAIKIL